MGKINKNKSRSRKKTVSHSPLILLAPNPPRPKDWTGIQGTLGRYLPGDICIHSDPAPAARPVLPAFRLLCCFATLRQIVNPSYLLLARRHPESAPAYASFRTSLTSGPLAHSPETPCPPISCGCIFPTDPSLLATAPATERPNLRRPSASHLSRIRTTRSATRSDITPRVALEEALVASVESRLKREKSQATTLRFPQNPSNPHRET